MCQRLLLLLLLLRGPRSHSSEMTGGLSKQGAMRSRAQALLKEVSRHSSEMANLQKACGVWRAVLLLLLRGGGPRCHSSEMAGEPSQLGAKEN